MDIRPDAECDQQLGDGVDRIWPIESSSSTTGRRGRSSRVWGKVPEGSYTFVFADTRIPS